MGLTKDIKSYLKDHHTVRRYRHILGVRDTAGKLAELYWSPKESGITVKKGGKKRRVFKSRKKFIEDVKIAALLHDLDKSGDTEEMWETIKKDKKLPARIKSSIRGSREVYHGFSGAYNASEIFGIKDEDILNSVRFHTTGRPGMSLMEKIIYLADYIEPQRTTPGVERIRKEALKNLNSACLMVAEDTIEYVRSKSSVSQISLEFKRDLKMKVKKTKKVKR